MAANRQLAELAQEAFRDFLIDEGHKLTGRTTVDARGIFYAGMAAGAKVMGNTGLALFELPAIEEGAAAK